MQRNPSSVRSGIFRPDGAGNFIRSRFYKDAAPTVLRLANDLRSAVAAWRLCAFALNRIAIPAASPEKQKPVERLVERILAAKAQAASADVSALERELDELVYALYGLTPEENALVQSAAK